MPRWTFLFVIAFLLAPTLVIHGQERAATGGIVGKVVDGATGVGLPGVMVLVEGGGPAAVTNDRGEFVLAEVAAGPRMLYVSLVGYALVRREVQATSGGSLSLVIPLTEGTGTYTESVNVAADRFRPGDTVVASQQVLGSADLQNLRGVLADDPLRAVQVLPGVATGDDLRSEFTVRGSDFMHMNLTLDGFSSGYLLHTVRAIEDRSATGSVAMINSDVLESVTLFNGGYAQRFGNRTGAEVDFQMREGSRERVQTRIAVSGTSASAVVEGPLAKRRGSWLFSFRQSYLDAILNHIQDGLVFGFTDAQFKMVRDLASSQRLELTVIGGRSRMEQAEEDAPQGEIFVGRNASAVGIAGWRIATRRASIVSRALASYNEFRNDDITGTILDSGDDTQYAARTDVAVPAGPHLVVEGGAHIERTSESRMRQRFSSTLNRYRSINDYSGSATRSGLYALTRVTVGPLSVEPGARADYGSLTGDLSASPWVLGELKLPRRFALRGGTGVYRQAPDFEQVIGSLKADAPGDERACQYDVGIEQRLGDAVRWQVTAYDREEADLFTRPAADTRLVNGTVVRGAVGAPYVQRVDAFARGVEVLLQRRSPTGLTGWFSYSYGRNRFHDSLTGQAYWSDLDQRHTVNVYAFYRVSDRTSVGMKLRAGSNMPVPGYYEERGGAYYVSAARNTERLPVYSRLDLRANRTFNWSRKRLTLFVEVLNVLNRDNVRYTPPGVNTRTGQVSGLFERLIPIVPSAGVLIEF